ncbi:alpha/beta fold hydrolase [Pseudoteredinibacter isoporae]|uniref:alpha/beta fold hydrolase n=1 Tax=Pseudoteredinibacter isoporae TaxID=570281 RepID=UPI0031062F55
MKSLKACFVIVSLVFSFAARAEYFHSNGVDIFYSDSKGKGEPLVLIHGFSMDSSMWHDTDIATKLAGKFRVITLDCRGHGKSGKPENTAAYGPQVGLDVIKLLDHLGIEHAHMAGYSMGAFVLGRLLVTHPHRLQTAVLVSGGFPSDSEEELAFQQDVARDMEAHGEKALAAVARAWKEDAVSDAQIERIQVAVQGVFGSKEIDEHFDTIKTRLELPEKARPVIVIPGADHDSQNAAVLQPEFIEIVSAFAGRTSLHVRD